MAEERLSAFRWRIKLFPILTASSTDTQPKHHPTPVCPVCISRILLPSSRAGSPSPDSIGPHPRTGPVSFQTTRWVQRSLLFFCMFIHWTCVCVPTRSILEDQGLLFLGFRFLSIVRSLLFGRTESEIQIGLRLNGRTNKRLTICSLFTRLTHMTSSI